MWDYEYGGGTSYFDNWGFSHFEAKNIYQPWSYFFSSPGYYSFRQQSIYTNLGRTYASVSTQTYSFRGSIQAQGSDISYNVPKDLGDGVKASGNTISWSWAQDTALTVTQGIAALNSIKGKLSSPQQSKRTAAFSCAEDFINRCKINNQGCSPTSSPKGGQQCQGTSGTHVDVVIYKGVNFQN